MLEAGAPRFPHDFPTTEPYRERAEVWEASERHKWERTPPSKRVNYERLGIDNPWKADWGNVLGRQVPMVAGYVPTQRDTIRPWLLSKYLASPVIDGAADAPDPAVLLYDKLITSRLGRGNGGLCLEVSANDLWRDALVQVQVELHGRGTLGDIAAIYLLRDDELRTYRSSSENLQEVRFCHCLTQAVSEISTVPRISTLSPRRNRGLPYVRGLLPLARTALWYRHRRPVQGGRSEETNAGVRSPTLRPLTQ